MYVKYNIVFTIKLNHQTVHKIAETALPRPVTTLTCGLHVKASVRIIPAVEEVRRSLT